MRTRSPTNEKVRARELLTEEAASASSPLSLLVDVTAAAFLEPAVSVAEPTRFTDPFAGGIVSVKITKLKLPDVG
jgi:hypothetical protein